MKKHVLFMAVLALLAFNCSTEEAPKINDQNISLEKESSLTLNMFKLLESEDFKNYINNKSVLQKSAQSKVDNKGTMLISDGYDLAFSVINWNTLELAFIGGLGKIEELPNGKGKFSIHTNNPSAGTFSFMTFEEWSSDCIEGPKGVFNFSYISEYFVDIFEPVPGLVFTSYIPTGENSSAEVGNGHCKISDGLPVYNEDFTEILECGEATAYKMVRLRSNKNANGDGEPFTMTVE